MSALRNSTMLQLCRNTRWPRSLLNGCARRRWNSSTSTAPLDGPAQTETNKAELTMKRFWKDVGIEKRGNNLVVTLDKRAVKTPEGNTLLLEPDQKLLAALVATEWDNQEKIIKPFALPITSLISRTIDNFSEETTRQGVEKTLLNFLDTDTVCFFHDQPEPLERLQTKYWVPLLDWTRETFGVELKVSNSILSVKQPQATKDKIEKVLSSLDVWELAALERAALTTKSLIIALALVKKHLSVEEAARVASVEVDSQIERWGEVEDTHDVDYQDVRRQLGSASLLLSRQS
ncbi:ATP12-domain-containing protein [Coprinopsis marcescibilis]|uniref:ATP12-domain-containing protein n=1 Tax=Coprinopsis marcescibilis TaxID=230819 RepID=A0A5C3L3Z5_COPMA|nr:ATP12-domain-containing protein [Coprinopsis marcescibilis]